MVYDTIIWVSLGGCWRYKVLDQSIKFFWLSSRMKWTNPPSSTFENNFRREFSRRIFLQIFYLSLQFRTKFTVISLIESVESSKDLLTLIFDLYIKAPLRYASIMLNSIHCSDQCPRFFSIFKSKWFIFKKTGLKLPLTFEVATFQINGPCVGAGGLCVMRSTHRYLETACPWTVFALLLSRDDARSCWDRVGLPSSRRYTISTGWTRHQARASSDVWRVLGVRMNMRR